MGLEFGVPDLYNMTWREIFALYDENFRKIQAFEETLTEGSIEVFQFAGGQTEYEIPELQDTPAGFIVMQGDNLMKDGVDYTVEENKKVVFTEATDESYVITIWVIQGRDIVTGSLKYVNEIKKLLEQTQLIHNEINLIREELEAYTYKKIAETTIKWIEEHPELVTHVQDGAISMAKLATDVKNKFETIENNITILQQENISDNSRIIEIENRLNAVVTVEGSKVKLTF